MELRNALIAAFAVDLQPTIAIDQPTVAALSAFISSKAAPASKEAGDTLQAPEDAVPIALTPQSVGEAVNAVVADILGANATSLEAGQPLMEAGLDSLGAVELRNALQSRFGVQLPATAVIDYPSVDALSAFLATVVAPTAPAASAGIGVPRYEARAQELEFRTKPPTMSNADEVSAASTA